MIEGAIATCESQQIGLDDLPIALRGAYGEVLMPSVQADDTMRAWGSRYARLVLEKSERNKRQACDVLDISYHTLNAYLNYRPREAPRCRCRRRCCRRGERRPTARRGKGHGMRLNMCHGRAVAFKAGGLRLNTRRGGAEVPRSRAVRTLLAKSSGGGVS